MRTRFLQHLVFAALALAPLLSACGVTYGEFTTCTETYEPGHVDSNGDPDPCHYNDPPPVDDACQGECVPLFPFGWEGPALLWTGPMADQPLECPPHAPIAGFLGYSGLEPSPSACPVCTCEPSTGSCALPTDLTARSAICAGTSALDTSFDAPANWDGSCTAVNAVPQGAMCGNEPCVQSLNIEAMTMTESGCTPKTQPVPNAAPGTWKTVGLACRGMEEHVGSCKDPGKICVPTSEPPPPGFTQCLFKEGDVACPAVYTEKHVFHQGFDDKRTCTPCACGAPDGGTCTALLSVYEDTACTKLNYMTMISSVMSVCGDIAIAGSALGSKSATSVTYSPGACAPSGGESMGDVELVGAATFCCLPSP